MPKTFFINKFINFDKIIEDEQKSITINDLSGEVYVRLDVKTLIQEMLVFHDIGHTITVGSISFKSTVTSTIEGSIGVVTSSIRVTIVQSIICAFIDIFVVNKQYISS